MPEPRLVPVPARALTDHLAAARPYLDNIVARSSGKWELRDIVKEILDRNIQLWLMTKGEETVSATLTEIINHPRRKILQGVACTGRDAPEWLHLFAQMEEWGRAQGCDGVELVSRPGWRKLMRPFGYVHTHDILEKPLTKAS